MDPFGFVGLHSNKVFFFLPVLSFNLFFLSMILYKLKFGVWIFALFWILELTIPAKQVENEWFSETWLSQSGQIKKWVVTQPV